MVLFQMQVLGIYPVNAFDIAINARFDENKLKRSLAFKSLGTTTTADVGRFIIGGTASWDLTI